MTPKGIMLTVAGVLLCIAAVAAYYLYDFARAIARVM